jgi:hypothetical protein
METIIIVPFKDCILEVTGRYFEAEEEFGYASRFEIEIIENIRSNNIIDLLEWANSLKTGTVVEEIERLVLEQKEFK